MVQDLQIINEAVVPLHTRVPNPYVILGEIPPSAKWFTVLDLKDTFFFFFAYHWLKNPNIFFAFEREAQGGLFVPLGDKTPRGIVRRSSDESRGNLVH